MNELYPRMEKMLNFVAIGIAIGAVVIRKLTIQFDYDISFNSFLKGHLMYARESFKRKLV